MIQQNFNTIGFYFWAIVGSPFPKNVKPCDPVITHRHKQVNYYNPPPTLELIIAEII